MRPALICVVLALAPAACTQFPELDRARAGMPADAPWPRLVPLSPLIAEAAAPAEAETAGEALAARAASLRARAARLRAAE